MQAGQNPLDPLTQLNSHRGYGAMAGLNPFADMGVNPNDPNMMQTLMNSPGFLQQMSAMMSNPQVMDQIIASNPQLAAIAPQVRQAFQSEGFRQLISDPQRLQQMLQMASLFNQGPGAGGLGGFGGFGLPQQPAFPAPGSPGGAATNPSASPTTSPNAGTGTTPAANPFNFFGAPPAGAGAVGGAQPPNPFGFDPALVQQLLGGGGLGSGAGGLGGFGGGGFGGGFGGLGGAPAAPADSRPPEERFQVQLQQLQDMGFSNAAQNVRALLATGGNVHSAIEYILGGGGL
ncbi:hypothetical protein DXG03_009032 [Asterophora parasitica]|uniref:UBA domain-containing protein n=1 Tax=Asterophora parasitica TaxID=117018 RepID=A0A9P7G4J1_9AGAR|nr:hypothetical protein DXG03_009032 [Asterophora parasitica]